MPKAQGQGASKRAARRNIKIAQPLKGMDETHLERMTNSLKGLQLTALDSARIRMDRMDAAIANAVDFVKKAPEDAKTDAQEALEKMRARADEERKVASEKLQKFSATIDRIISDVEAFKKKRLNAKTKRP